MGRIEDLQTPLSELTEEELMQRISDVREDRKINKYAITQRVATKRKKIGKTAKALKDLNPEELTKLIEELDNEG